MKTPVTVLMPVYNAEKYLAEAIDSVLMQSHKDFEFLIINDGSTDHSLEIINRYSDSRIRVITQKNGGVSAALNTGLKHATGEYIARFDADDVCYPTRIEEQYHFMRAHDEYVIVGADIDYIDKDGEYLFSFTTIGHTNEEIKERISLGCPFVHSAVMYKKDVVLAMGGYEVKAHTFEDYFLWMKLIDKGKVFNFNKAMIKVRFNPESVTVDYKDYNETFLRLREKALKTGIITDEEGDQLLKSVKRLDRKTKEFSYNNMLGKKYLWNNYNPRKARAHLWKAFKLKPFSLSPYVLTAMSFLPKAMIFSIYNKTKK